MDQLPRFCGELPADVQHQIQQLSLEQLLRISGSQFDFKSLEDLKNWLGALAG